MSADPPQELVQFLKFKLEPKILRAYAAGSPEANKEHQALVVDIAAELIANYLHHFLSNEAAPATRAQSRHNGTVFFELFCEHVPGILAQRINKDFAFCQDFAKPLSSTNIAEFLQDILFDETPEAKEFHMATGNRYVKKQEIDQTVEFPSDFDVEKAKQILQLLAINPNPNCWCCGATPLEKNVPKFGGCGQCRLATYCSRECQSKHWTHWHKKECKIYAEAKKQLASGIKRI